MDYGDHDGGGFGDDEHNHEHNKPPTLPADLPKSLDDRRLVSTEFVPETEMYDGWQGAHRPSAATATTAAFFPLSS